MGAAFFPPELAIQDEFELGDGADIDTPHDVLRRLYFERLHRAGRDERVDREVVRLVLEHAKRIVSHPTRRQTIRVNTFAQKPWAELAIEETLEEHPRVDNPEEVLVEERFDQRFPCTVMLDCSSSMSGEKHLLGSIAVAVLLIQLPPEDAAVVTFSSTSEVIKKLRAPTDPAETVLRFLRRQPKGFTNIYSGLEAGLGQARVGRFRTGLLASDGRSTEGGDPLEIASRFENLVVLHLHGPGSDLEASRRIAQKGNGICVEVQEFSQMPRRMYDAVRWLARRAH